MPEKDRRFWIRYLGEGTDLTGHPLQEEFSSSCDDPPAKITIGFSASYSLEIEVDGGHRLRLLDTASSQTMELGWMDCHHMSDAFRFEELEGICRVSTMFPSWQVRALLSHYVAPMPENIDALVSKFRASLQESELFSDSEANLFADYMRRVVREQFRWTEDPDLGWIGSIESGDEYPWIFPYTLRTRENHDFDFPFLNAFLSYSGRASNATSAWRATADPP